MTAESESEMKSRMNESEAILRAREGDAEGFAYLYDSHRKHVYSVCLRMLKNSADAEDLMQQAFLQVFRKIGTFRGESGFSTWLHRVTINAVLMHSRTRRTKNRTKLPFRTCRLERPRPRSMRRSLCSGAPSTRSKRALPAAHG